LFYQLRALIEDTALIAGMPVIKDDSAYTSQTCIAFGHCERKIRSGLILEWRECDHAMEADQKATRNIAAWVAAQPEGSSQEPYGNVW
jgi:transposase